MTFARWCIAVSLSASVLACGGGDRDGDGCAAPLAITQGVWCVVDTSTTNTCSAPLQAPWQVTFTQDGNALTAVSEYGPTYTGTICGNAATVSAGNSNVTMSARVVFSVPSNGVATIDWKWQDPPCSGTNTAVFTAGACP